MRECGYIQIIVKLRGVSDVSELRGPFVVTARERVKEKGRTSGRERKRERDSLACSNSEC